MTITEKQQMIRFLKETNLYHTFCKQMHEFYIKNRFAYLSESFIFKQAYVTEHLLINAFLKKREQGKYYAHVFLTTNKKEYNDYYRKTTND